MRYPLTFLPLIFSVLLVACAHQKTKRSLATDPPVRLTAVMEKIRYTPLDLRLRAGFSPEVGELKACVIYLQGLGDSIRNHRPYFSHLNEAGYRVLYFDYLGQGGSEGNMDNTRVQVDSPAAPRDKFYEIQEQARFVWSYYKDRKNHLGQDCNRSKVIAIGWSTGGLAAYRMAHEHKLDAVVLIAPTLPPNWKLEEAWDEMSTFKQAVTEITLRRKRYGEKPGPHLDPLHPASPGLVPAFASNVIETAKRAENWNIEGKIPGLVFLSGREDTNVIRDATLRMLARGAPQFEVKSYDGALHELDNEPVEVSNDVHARTVQFLDRVH